MGVPRAGVLPQDSQLRGVVIFRTGERSRSPRKGIRKSLTFVVAAGFDVARAKIFRLLPGAEFGPNPSAIEATKNARQKDFKILSVSNLEELLKRRWACITDDDIVALASNEEPINTQFAFEFFVYLAPVVWPTDGIRRATADRVRAAAAEIVTLQAEGRERFVPIATHHLAIHRARQPEGTPFAIPEDNTMQQARALDAVVAALEDTAAELEEDVVEIEVKLFGTWVKMRVKRSTLREAVGLPQHDIFTRGIFHGFRPEAMMPQGEDVPDEDHQMSEN
ncbi:hypothetical protein PHYSODRAFT_336432 [Phytophthora sojae]|uniref:Uncharacterized protein n=1 Tax=Phytophthora sojae (strain P6497) TaxID=1094619 RepID=G4ZY36_PHYSP|nr:hypothetical protein PHYSODRAFT_336432 [Phytophthora sojae]EGZ11942.1 hypothetical protein PHYSODRAFT_336432 [Phytophthora sojae]|eukprot:XP_009532275.1 hypothetical protein PHYSODRAFT_336432 [Phytophthora sojae]